MARRPCDGKHIINWKSYHHRSCNTFNYIHIDCASFENLADVTRRRNFKFVKGNICSSDLVNFVLEEEEIDTIVHLAAQTHVDNSFGNSFSFTQNNILGTHVLLESAKVHGIRRFVHVSTDEVYGEGAAGQEPMFEDNVLEVRLALQMDRAEEEEVGRWGTHMLYFTVCSHACSPGFASLYSGSAH